MRLPWYMIVYGLWDMLTPTGVTELPGLEFSRFLHDMFRSLGFESDLMDGAGDMGVDLVLRWQGKSAVVQAKRLGKDSSVNRRAVSSAIAGKKYYGADHALVVSNRGFTEGAKTLAEGRAILVHPANLNLMTIWHLVISGQSIQMAHLDRMDGSDFERFVAQVLLALGYDVALPAGPGDLGADILAFGPPGDVVVQVKRSSGQLSRSAVADAVAAAEYHATGRSLLVTNTTLSAAAREFARGTGCEVWDRQELGRLLKDHPSRMKRLTDSMFAERPSDPESLIRFLDVDQMRRFVVEPAFGRIADSLLHSLWQLVVDAEWRRGLAEIRFAQPLPPSRLLVYSTRPDLLRPGPKADDPFRIGVSVHVCGIRGSSTTFPFHLSRKAQSATEKELGEAVNFALLPFS